MTSHSIGIRSLSVSFPNTIRTNEYWRDQFPDLFVHTQSKRVRQPRLSQSPEENREEFDIWSQEVAPYLNDPFRGNVERRVLCSNESSLTLEVRAAQDALVAANLHPDQVDLAIVSSLFSETISVDNTAALAAQLQLRCPAWNLESTCSSALVALQTARALIQTEAYRNVLVVVSQFGSRTVDESDTLSWSMGDGAGAFVVSSLQPDQGVLSTHLISTATTCGTYCHEWVSDGQGVPRLRIRTGENASRVAETAVECVRLCCNAAVTKAGIDLDRIHCFAFNTPTAWYASVCTRALGIDPERTLNLYPRYANIGSVLPIANLYHAAQSGKLRENDLVLVYTNGAGATAGAMIMRWGEVALGQVPAPPLTVAPEQEKVHLAVLAPPRLSPEAVDENERDAATVNLSKALSKATLLAAAPEQRQPMLENYLLTWLTHALQLPPAHLTAQQTFAPLLDSLMALMLKSRIESDLQVQVPISQFFGENTIAHLIDELLNQLALADLTAPDSRAELDGEREKISQWATATGLPTLIPAPEQRYEPFPLTDMQYAFWVGRSGVLELGEVANHGYYEIAGQDLDLERLNGALQKLIERHEMLRSIVLPDGQQQVQATVPVYQMPVQDLRGKDEATIRAALAAIRHRLSHQVLPADQWPLFEFSATRLDGGRIRLHISYDLQVFDAWSLFRLFDEWVQLYQHPDVALPALDLSFRDYVLAEQALQTTELYERSRTYWLSRLNSLPAAPDLPLAKNPKALKQHRTRRYENRLTQPDWQQLQQRSAQAGLTPSGLLLAAFAEILSRWSKTPQFTLSLALFNRLPLHPQVNDILGDFTSVTLLAVDHSAPESFRDRAIRLQKQLWQDLEHRYFSGVQVTRELARQQGTAPSAMPVIFTSTLGFRSLGQETLTFSHFGELVYGISQASQAWMDVQVWQEKAALVFNWDVVEELFPDGLIAAMFESYSQFLKQLATTESAWMESTRQLLPAAQLAQRSAINATDAPLPDTLLHELFAAQVSLRPQATAVVTTQQRLTYQELSDRAHQLGHRLRHMGARPNRLVAIVMEKGWEQIVAVLGILMSGAAYVPIDPSLPPERLRYLLGNSEANLVLTQSWLVENLNLPEGVQLLCIDDFCSTGGRLELDNLPPLQSVQSPDDLTYVIYTSGSTGSPKGVMITHRNVLNVVTYTNRRFQVGADDRILSLTALNHDLSAYDIFGLLSAGGMIVLPDADAVKDPGHWATLMQREQVTLWNSVPALMEMLIDQAEERSTTLPPSLRLVTLGGDWLPLSLPDRLRALVPTTQILSIGGPTETTIWNIGYLIETVDPTWKSIPYGQPMPNSKYYILNDALEDCPVWVAGQMYCAGVQLAKGYWRDEAKTRERFIKHPRTGERLYRTGDSGRYLPDGNIEFLGRVDFQIKLRGHRIESGEIEAALTQHPAVRSAVVTAMRESLHTDRLVAYIVPHPPSPPNLEELKHFLSQKLPAHMVPSAFVILNALPLSANGKVDRQALLTQTAHMQTLQVDYVAPGNRLEKAVTAIFQESLELDKVGINDNFFDLGGNSLLIAKVYRALLSQLPEATKSISLMDLFSYPTVKALAQYLNSEQSISLSEKTAHLEHQLSQGKSRLKQRLKKTKSIQS